MFTIIANTEHFILVSKHPGVDFHKGKALFGITELVRKQTNTPTIYPLHRLDTVTSGLLLFAKTLESAKKLAAQFREKRIDKFYIAIGGTHPKKKQGVIKGDMKKGRSSTWIVTKTTNNPAITQFFSSGMGNGMRFYILRPQTGRTHQIRVALKAIGAPVIGDTLYAGHRYDHLNPDRVYLHSYAIGFSLEDEYFRYTNPPSIGRFFTSEPFLTIFGRYRDPWVLPWR